MTTFKGKWKNQLGSILEITNIDAKEGLFSGTYITKVGDEDARKKPCDVTGYVKDKLIGFTVSYGDASCICSWVGRLEPDGKIHTVWTFVSAEGFHKNDANGQIEAGPAALWEAFRVQTDIFEPVV